MARFQARLLKGGFLEILGLEEFVEQKLAALKARLGFGKAKPAPAPAPLKVAAPPPPEAPKAKAKAGKKAPAAKKAKAPAAKKAKTTAAPIGRKPVTADPLVDALKAHPRQAELLAAGKAKDQLLRALIPLYVAKDLDVDVNSGAISRFWRAFGVPFASPNAAKALREHVGFARDTKQGKRLTPNGVKYVDAALAKRPAA